MIVALKPINGAYGSYAVGDPIPDSVPGGISAGWIAAGAALLVADPEPRDTDVALGDLLNVDEIRFADGSVQGSGVQTAVVDLTTEQLVELDSDHPIEVIAAPGPGKAIMVLGALFQYVPGTVPFGSSLDLELVYGAESTNAIAQSASGGNLASLNPALTQLQLTDAPALEGENLAVYLTAGLD